MVEVGAFARQLKHHEMPHHVGLHVYVRINRRVDHARLGSQVYDGGEIVVLACERQHPCAVGDIRLHKLEIFVVLQQRKSCELQARIVVVAEVVYADNGVATCQQSPRHVRPYKTGSAGYENGHQLNLCKYALNETAKCNSLF